jgi:cation diffusion facilitator CzcD-associated flavoprotein CzcO
MILFRISGICTAVQLQLQLKIKDYVIFEEQEELGGAWFLNTYPGCCCDIPSYFYSYSFEENPSN